MKTILNCIDVTCYLHVRHQESDVITKRQRITIIPMASDIISILVTVQVYFVHHLGFDLTIGILFMNFIIIHINNSR